MLVGTVSFCTAKQLSAETCLNNVEFSLPVHVSLCDNRYYNGYPQNIKSKVRDLVCCSCHTGTWRTKSRCFVYRV
jgi:hypothetical protein